MLFQPKPEQAETIARLRPARTPEPEPGDEEEGSEEEDGDCEPLDEVPVHGPVVRPGFWSFTETPFTF
jgi:hypothetical protein